jgi:glycogen operon protein
MAFGKITVEDGKALPLGATLSDSGVNFAVFSRHASAVSLLIFESAEKGSSFKEIKLDKKTNRTGDIWHCFIPGLKEGACYLYRADGPYLPEKGHRFNFNKTLLDPYAKALTPLEGWDMKTSFGYDFFSKSTDLS